MSGAPTAIRHHYGAMANNCEALFAQISVAPFHLLRFWIEIEGRGQRCFDEVAARHTAYHLHNHFWNHGAGVRFHKWKVKMRGPLVGPNAKLSGNAPKNFKITDYLHTTRRRSP